VVAKSGGDFNDPIAALNSITDASPTNPYLIKIMPGIYDIGSNIMYTKNGVDIEGSGRSTTVIKGTAVSNYSSMLFVNTNGEVRQLTLENTCPADITCHVASVVSVTDFTFKDVAVTVNGKFGRGIDADGPTGLTLDNVDITVMNTLGTGGTCCYAYGITVERAQVRLVNSSINMTNPDSSTAVLLMFDGANLWVENSSITGDVGDRFKTYGGGSRYVEMNDVLVEVPGRAIVGNDMTMDIFNSRISGSTAIMESISTFNVAGTMLSGARNISSGTNVKFVNCYDGAFNPIPNQ
jgi:pectin methylesterase-like acyl-CoA thioesterase